MKIQNHDRWVYIEINSSQNKIELKTALIL